MMFSELINLMFDYWFFGFLIVYLFFSLILYFFFYRRIKKDFVMTKAKIVKIKINHLRSRRAGTLIMEYNVDGKVYKCYRRISLFLALKDYPVGTNVDVWYHKDDPYFWRLRTFF